MAQAHTNGKPKNSRPQQTTGLLDKQPPFDLQSEVGVIGSAILMFEVLDDIAAILTAEDFYDDAHQKLWRHLVAMHEAGRRFDATLLVDRLKAANEYEAIGGAPYLSKVINAVPNAAHARHYADIVKGHSTARKLIHACTETLQDAYETRSDQNELVARAESAIARVSDSTIQGRETTSLNDAVIAAMLALNNRMDRGADGSLAVGLDGFADCMGLKTGGVTIVAGRPSMGKSAAAVNIAMNVARRDLVVFFASLEMTASELADRMLSSYARVDCRRMMRGTIGQEDRLAIVDASSAISQWPLYFDDRPSMTLAQIGAAARKLKRRRGRLDLLIVDYLQLVEPDNSRDDRVEQLAKISRGCKRMARELQVPMLVLAQVNRQADDNADKRPRLHQLKGCVVGETRLTLASGEVTAISDLRRGEYVLAIDSSQRVVTAEVRDVWRTGERPVVRLTTQGGRVFCGTPDHRIMTQRGWVAIQDIADGDSIAVPYRTPAGPATAESPDLCRLAGYLAGNGAMQRNRAAGVIIPDQEAFADAAGIIRAHWPEVTIRVRNPENGWNDAVVSRPVGNGGGRPGCNPFLNWLEAHGMRGQRDRTKRVPAFVFDSGPRGAAEFLAGYLATDGCVKFKDGGRKASVHFDTTSPQLAQDAALLCSRLGIVVAIQRPVLPRRETEVRHQYRISVSEDADNLRTAASEIHPRGVRGRRLSRILDLPRRATASSALSLPSCVSEHASTVARWRHQGKSLGRRRCRELAAESGDATLAMWAWSDIVWEGVRSVEDAGAQAVWDAEIAGVHNFIADGVVAHNCGDIEQDADSVVFVHRPAWYRNEAAPVGVAETAELIVAKNRNGPTGTIETLWWGPWMTWANKASARHGQEDHYAAREQDCGERAF